MTQPDSTQNFNEKSKPAIPEYVFVYNHTGDDVEVRFEDVTIKTPQENKTLIENLSFTLKGGERAGLTGPNGGGKSSTFRVMAELEASGSGRIHITIPEGKEVLIASQEIRRVPTTLPGILAYKDYPNAMTTNYTDNYTHAQYEQCLDDAHLPQLKAHLPWNTVKPEILFPIFQAVLDQQLYHYAGKITKDAARHITAAMIVTLDKKMHLPETISEYYEPHHHDELIEKLSAHITEKLTPDDSESNRPVVFPSYTGRKIARKVIENSNNTIKNWLLQGNKMRLSGGEQNKLVLARMFLQADTVALFLCDEITAALKEDVADELYDKLFQEKAKGVAAIGIIHNKDLLKHFTHHLELDTQRHVSFTALDREKYPEFTPDAPEV